MRIVETLAYNWNLSSQNIAKDILKSEGVLHRRVPLRNTFSVLFRWRSPVVHRAHRVVHRVPKSFWFVFATPIFTSSTWLIQDSQCLSLMNENTMWTYDLEYDYEVVQFSHTASWPNSPIFSTLFCGRWIHADKKPSRFIHFLFQVPVFPV